MLAGDGVSTPRAAGSHAALRVLLVVHRSWSNSAPGCSISYKGLHVTAPAALRERIGRGNGARLAERLARMRDRPGAQLHEEAMLTVCVTWPESSPARRTSRPVPAPDHSLVRELHPTLMDEPGPPDQRRQAPGVRPGTLPNQAGFARGNGTAPQPASSGQTTRHRLPAAATAKPTTRSTRSP